MIEIDQAPIGRTPRSNPATYTGVFAPIRELFAMLPESRERGYKPGRFSFNVKGGRCEACQGDGLRRIEMNFLPDVYVTCEVCRGRRYNSETLAVRYKGHSISDLLDMPIDEALKLLENIPQIQQKLANAGRSRPRLRPARPIRHHAFRRRSAAHQAGARTFQAPDRPHALHSRRAHHRPAFRRRAKTARRAATPGVARQHRADHRAPSRRDQASRLDHRSRAPKAAKAAAASSRKARPSKSRATRSRTRVRLWRACFSSTAPTGTTPMAILRRNRSCSSLSLARRLRIRLQLLRALKYSFAHVPLLDKTSSALFGPHISAVVAKKQSPRQRLRQARAGECIAEKIPRFAPEYSRRTKSA